MPTDDQDTPMSAAAFWAMFYQKYPTKEHAEAELIARCRAAKEPCCDKPDLTILPGGRGGRCKKCKRETWFTAGTFIQDIRNFTAWLAAILAFEHGVVMSAKKFAEYARCNYSTGWRIIQKLRMVIERHLQTNGKELHSRFFISAIYKRSLATPAFAHPIAEIADLESLLGIIEQEQEQPPKPPTAEEILDSFDDQYKTVYDTITDEPIHCDVIAQTTGLPMGLITAILVELEMAGLIQSSGNRFRRVDLTQNPPQQQNQNTKKKKQVPQRPATQQPKQQQTSGPKDSTKQPNDPARGSKSPWSSILNSPEAVLNFLNKCFQGISRKYLQLYIAQLWCVIDNEIWIDGGVFRAFFYCDPIGDKDVLDYCSDLMIKTPFLAK